MSALPWPSGPATDDDGRGPGRAADGVGGAFRRQSQLPHPYGASEGYGTLEVYGGGALLLACLALHIWAMFPAYPGAPATPVMSLPHDVAMFVCLELGWAVAATLVLLRASVSGGVALALGLGLVELGLAAYTVVGGFEVHDPSVPGGWMVLGGVGLGLGGALLAASAVEVGGPRRDKRVPKAGRTLATFPVATLAVVTFWLSWQSGTVVYTSTGAFPVDGDAFAQPTGLMAADVGAGLAIVIIAVLAAYWAPPRLGAWALAGAAVAVVSQLAAGLAEVIEPLRDAVNQGVAAGLVAARSNISLTPDYAVCMISVSGLLALAAWAVFDGRNLPGRGVDGTAARPAETARDRSATGGPGPSSSGWPHGTPRWPL
ncbi:MAG TPA: hypothetical protein VME46_12735 [Acidimicrobiales bacterium]|nr:hypothetical protein [Acidimicrobiales bacterium]